MAAETSVPWKKRADLVVTYSHERGRKAYVVKDPLNLQYFSLSEVEFFVLECLDGKRSLRSILSRIRQHYPEQEIDEAALKQFLPTLIGSSLVVSTAIGYGQMLANRQERRKNHGSRWLSRLNIISFRWRGFDPNSLLKLLDRYLGWIYSKPVFIASLCLFLAAIAAFLIRVSTRGLPSFDFQALFTFQNVPLLFAAIVLIKIVHEIGHGLTCVHYGGECHEIGVLFIAFCPLLYCDTTDSWQHASRWNRANVAVAGIFVELVIASLCCLLWSISIPGVLSLILFNIMLICSINTVLINGNPLLRYDGYYVISDMINYPNLGPEARRTALAWLDKLVYGSPLTSDVNFSLKRVPLVFYGAASATYRIFVMMMILWAVHQLLKGYGLGTFTMLVAFPMFAGFLWALVISVARHGAKVTAESSMVKKVRVVMGVCLLIAGIGMLLVYPFPHNVVVPFGLEPGACKPVFVTVPGKIVSMKAPLSSVQRDSVIGALENPEIRLANMQTIGEVAQRELRLENYKRFRSLSPVAQSALPAAENALAIAKDRAAVQQQRLARLTITSPATGTLFPARNVVSQKTTVEGVRYWSGTVLDEQNRNAWADEQTLVGWVGEPSDFEAVAYVPQHQMEFIQRQANVRLVFMSSSSEECLGNVLERGTEVVEIAPREVFHNQLVSPDPTLGQFHPSETLYRVRIKIDSGIPGPLYSTGFAKIECSPLSLLSRFWRAMTHAFALDG